MKTNLSKKSLSTDASLLKQINYARILGLLRCQPHLSRAEIARQIGLTRSTVTVITAELITQGLLKESGEILQSPNGGRPGVSLTLNPEGAFFIGAAIEAGHLTVIELNLAAQMVSRIQEPLEGNENPETVLNQLVQLIERIRQSNPERNQRLQGVGLTIQGTLNLEGVVICAPFLNWYGIDLRSYLETHIDLPVFVDNDANAAALAEVYLGSAIQSNSLLYLLINKGMGAGIVIHNRVFRGAYGTAGEVGALLIDPFSPINDDSGQRRDVGTLVGREGLLRRYCERGGEASDIDDLVNCLVQGEPLAQAVVQEWTQVLGWELINLVSTLNPERVVIGGPLTVLLPHVKEQLNAMLRDYVPGNGAGGFFSDPKARFEASTFGEDASAMGGAVLVYQSLFQMPDLVLLRREGEY
jgi:predicted NBD/HSP70 family sugar kinase